MWNLDCIMVDYKQFRKQSKNEHIWVPRRVIVRLLNHISLGEEYLNLETIIIQSFWSLNIDAVIF